MEKWISSLNPIIFGEFSKIKSALINISKTLTATLLEIKVASNQIASGSDQVAAGAQALSQGATEQSASIQELTATIQDISVRSLILL